ncbi:hypothetical protein KEM56_007413 [Ascosphaera pollenicola]|nr:hypothetical protein KEM56_007413 [Ascosphaera pollenicola]
MSHDQHLPHEDNHEDEGDVFFDPNDAEQEVELDDDVPMEDFSDGEEGEEEEPQEMAFQNDSAAHFDKHNDSIFCIAQHPTRPSIVMTGGGDDVAYIFDSTPNKPVLPQSYNASPQVKQERDSLEAIAKLDGHEDSVNGVAFTKPNGQYAVTAGMDGKLRAYMDVSAASDATQWKFLAETKEVDEINWIEACPSTGDEETKNVVAVGAIDGSVWVFRIDAADRETPIAIVQTFFQHTAPCTAGAWTPDGKLLATVSEDATFFVYDVFGAAAAAGYSSSSGTSTVVALSPDDQRFAVDGGLYSVAISPNGTIAAVGGAEGHIKIISLPRLSRSAPAKPQKGGKARPGRAAPAGPAGGGAAAAGGAAAGGAPGTLLASLQAQTDGVETLSFSSPPMTLLAAGSVDGSIALFDCAHRFAVRRHIKSAHEDSAVVKVGFVHDAASLNPAAPNKSWLLTSVGIDGVVRRWDARGGTAAAGFGLLKEWRGHFGLSENPEGEERSGGILGFVQTSGRIVTAGDDLISLVFEEE